MKITITVKISGPETRSVVAAEFNRTGPLKAASLGLNLGEAKTILRQVQRQIVTAQLAEHVEAQRACGRCGVRRWVKDWHEVSHRTTTPMTRPGSCHG